MPHPNLLYMLLKLIQQNPFVSFLDLVNYCKHLVWSVDDIRTGLHQLEHSCLIMCCYFDDEVSPNGMSINGAPARFIDRGVFYAAADRNKLFFQPIVPDNLIENNNQDINDNQQSPLTD